MLGANVVNMALIGAGAGGLLRNWFLKKNMSDSLATGLAAAAAVELAALALGIELAFSGKASGMAIGTLLGIHALVAVVEGVATVALVKVCGESRVETKADVKYVPLVGLIMFCLAAAPFASVFPDAFEWSMARFNLLPQAPNFVNAPFADYVAFGSEFTAAIIGMVAVAVSGWGMFRILAAKAGKVNENV